METSGHSACRVAAYPEAFTHLRISGCTFSGSLGGSREPRGKLLKKKRRLRVQDVLEVQWLQFRIHSGLGFRVSRSVTAARSLQFAVIFTRRLVRWPR